MSDPSDGATPEVKSHDDMCCGVKGRKHYWRWKWLNGEMTDVQVCGTCNEERVPPRLKEIRYKNDLSAQE